MRNVQVRAANELLYRLADLEQHGKKTMINFVYFMGEYLIFVDMAICFCWFWVERPVRAGLELI